MPKKVVTPALHVGAQAVLQLTKPGPAQQALAAAPTPEKKEPELFKRVALLDEFCFIYLQFTSRFGQHCSNSSRNAFRVRCTLDFKVESGIFKLFATST